MKLMQKLFVLLLMLFCLSQLIGCDTEEPENPAKGSETETDPLPVKEEKKISVSKLASYSIVFPKDNDGTLTDAALRLRNEIRDRFSVTLDVKDDDYRYFSMNQIISPHEILIGRTSREETTAFLKNMPYGDAGFAMVGEKLVICGGTDSLTLSALDAFLSVIEDGDVFYSNFSDTRIPGEKTWEKASYEIAGFPLSDFRILLNYNTDLSFAEELYQYIAEKTGICLTILKSGMVDSKQPIPSFLIDCGELFDASFKSSNDYESTEWSYRICDMEDVPVIILNGQTLYDSVRAGEALIGELMEKKTIPSGTSVRKTGASLNEAPEKKEIPVDRILFGQENLSQYRIVYAESESGRAQFAALELSSYLKKAAGIELPVVTDAETPVEKEIVVGITNRETEGVRKLRATLVNDGILYYADGERLFIGSHSDAGQIYAVYHFLEDYIGCRFYANDFEVIHNASTVVIPSDLVYSYSSPLYYRYTDWGMDLAQQRKLGLNKKEDVMYTYIGGDHSLGSLAKTGGHTTPNPCLCDDTVFQTVLSNIRRLIDENPGCRVISVTQNDTDEHCTCEKCAAIEAAENASGLMLSFVNRLAEEIEKDHPEVKLLTFAYRWTREPPKTIKARDNVIIWICSIECCFCDPLSDSDCEKNAPFVADITKWTEYCKQIYIWDYTTDYISYTYPFPNFRVLRDNMTFFVNHSVSGVYEEGCYQQFENAEFSRLRSYLIGKLEWNPYMSEEEYQALINEFLADYYGAGWQYVRYYIDAICSCYRTCLDIYDRLSPDSFTIDAAVLSDYWQKAIKGAENAETRLHCEKSAFQMECLYLPNERSHQRFPEELKQRLYDIGVRYLGEDEVLTLSSEG